MKKSYLLIALLSVLFLWLGSVSFAQSCEYATCVQTANSDKADCTATPWSNAATCNSAYSAAFSACSQCAGSPSINQCGGPCPSWQTCQPDPTNTDNPFTCQEAPTTFTPPTTTPSSAGATTCAQRDNDWVPQNADGSCPNGYLPDWFPSWGQTVKCCNPQPAWSTTTLCNVAGSKYLNKPNSVLSFWSQSCECAKWYGDLYHPDWTTTCELCSTPGVCCGVKLNTTIPFIGNCIATTAQDPTSTINETTAFPILVTALVKILISVILIASFVMIVAGGVMWSTGDAKWGKDLIIKVAIGLAILGASGVILRLVNPNFFG